MNLSPRKLVRTFYEADLIHNDEIIKNYVHADVNLHWQSSSGLFKMKYADIVALFKGMRDAFEFSRCDISHVLADKEKVSIRYDFIVKPIESHMEEIMGHFICIWEFKDDKLHTGYMVSQSADTSSKNLITFI